MSREPNNSEDINKIAGQFQLAGSVTVYKLITTGHIHTTYHLAMNNNGKYEEYILQKLNKHVFEHPHWIMQNIQKVSQHLMRSNYPKHILKPIPILDSEHCLVASGGDYWRVFPFYKNTVTFDTVHDEDMAYDVAFTFGEYIRYLDDLDPDKLHIPIIDFHNTPLRFSSLEKIIESADHHRLVNARDVINEVKKRSHLLSYYNPLPKHIRIIHSDTKLNNVLLDATTYNAVCVIDLDTIMPGVLSMDFGDMVRTMTPSVNEDDRNIDQVAIRQDILKAVSEGFLEGLNSAIRPGEKENLYTGAALIIYEQAIRFLTDYLNMDVYYPVTFETQNLVRTQNQLNLLADYLRIINSKSIL